MFYYHIDYWDEIDQERRQEAGLLAASSYSKAAERVSRYYGADFVISLYLEEWEDILSKNELIEQI